MAVSQEQLLQIIQHNSTTLCSPKGQKKLHEMAGAIDVNPEVVSDEWDNFTLSGPMPSESKSAAVPQTYSNKAATSRMPENIKESLMNNPIDVSALSQGLGDTSFLDNAATKRRVPGFNQEKLNEIKQKEIEQQYVPQQQYIPQQPFIDYNYLKHIISECIEEYFSKQPLNEQTTLKQIGLSDGKIKLVDNSGNVFGANLEFKGNLNDRKKK